MHPVDADATSAQAQAQQAALEAARARQALQALPPDASLAEERQAQVRASIAEQRARSLANGALATQEMANQAAEREGAPQLPYPAARAYLRDGFNTDASPQALSRALGFDPAVWSDAPSTADTVKGAQATALNGAGRLDKQYLKDHASELPYDALSDAEKAYLARQFPDDASLPETFQPGSYLAYGVGVGAEQPPQDAAQVNGANHGFRFVDGAWQKVEPSSAADRDPDFLTQHAGDLLAKYLSASELATVGAAYSDPSSLPDAMKPGSALAVSLGLGDGPPTLEAAKKAQTLGYLFADGQWQRFAPPTAVAPPAAAVAPFPADLKAGATKNADGTYTLALTDGAGKPIPGAQPLTGTLQELSGKIQVYNSRDDANAQRAFASLAKTLSDAMSAERLAGNPALGMKPITNVQPGVDRLKVAQGLLENNRDPDLAGFGIAQLTNPNDFSTGGAIARNKVNYEVQAFCGLISKDDTYILNYNAWLAGQQQGLERVPPPPKPPGFDQRRTADGSIIYPGSGTYALQDMLALTGML